MKQKNKESNWWNSVMFPCFLCGNWQKSVKFWNLHFVNWTKSVKNQKKQIVTEQIQLNIQMWALSTERR